MYDGQGTAAGDVRIGFLRGDRGSWTNITSNGEQILANMIDYASNYTLSTASLSNSPASDITGVAATVGGVVTDTGGATPTVTIYYGDNDGGTSAGSWDDSIGIGTQSGAFSTGIIGLTPNTTYYFRCFASNSEGDSWAGSTTSFMTAAAASPPSIINHSATTIGHELAEANGEVTDTGGDPPAVIVYYGDNDGGTDPGNWDSEVALGTETGTFTRELPGLTHDTTYYYRCYATNSGGAAWAPSSEPFTTLAYSPPVVINAAPSNITGISALANGEVTDTGDDPPVITIYYGDNDGGTDTNAWDNSAVLPVQASTFSWPLSPLAPLTTYYYRCHAQNVAGEDWAPGSESFTTLDFNGDVFINEFLASNEGSYTNYPNPNQVPGRTDDWIELLNVSVSAVDLSGWHLTDNPGNLDKWTFPPGTSLGSGEFLIVYASSDDAPDTNGNFHTDFKLSAGGDYVALVSPGLAVVSEFGPAGADFPNQDADVSYGILPTTAGEGYFEIPTPGAPNDPGGQARVADTKFSVDRGIYSNAFDVVITTATVGADIYYSTNGNPPIDAAGAPTASADLYAGPVHISRSTVLRAAAVKSQLRATDIDTHTYLLMDIAGAGTDGTDPGGFNAAILEQTQPAGWPHLEGYHSTYPDDADWDMDQSISKSTAQADRLPTGTTRAQALLRGLLDIPTLSIAMDIDEFGGDNGIYTHANWGGFSSERFCSAELIQGDNSAAFQENCGIRMQGGASRSKAAKHSLSLRFRDEYGAGKLREKVFPHSDVEEFNVIQMRANYNNSWIHSNSGQRSRGSMIRDQWARDSLLDMGQEDGGHGVMVHLYVNGLYMGIHIMGERQDAAHYAAYNGGDEDLLDARNGGAFIDGNATAWNAMASVVSTGTWSQIQQVLDVDSYIDYRIMNVCAGNNDIKTGGNWRAAGGGPFPPGQPELMAPWKIYSWDAENILNGATGSYTPTEPTGLGVHLDGMSDYQMRFADRLQKHFFNGGALTPAQNAARWMARAGQLDRAIIAEAARWGDHFLGDNPSYFYDRNDDWLAEQDRLINDVFPVRSANVLDFYEGGVFWPDTDAPVFNVNGSPQLGGEIPGGGTLSITATSGTIYYTLDGSDPRLDGGAINPGALTIASGATVSLPSSGPIRARVYDGGEWSPIMEATFYLEALPGTGDLEVTEIHYHPTPPTLLESQAASGLTVPIVLEDNDFEFVEIQNISGVPLNLDGVQLASGIDCVLSNYVIAPGARAIAVENPEVFLIRYPGSSSIIAGTFSGNLSNGGEQMSVFAADTTLLAEFIYNDSAAWPGRADGEGSSLELVATGLPYGDSESWRPSSEYHGSPGSAGLGPDGRVVINEVLSHTDLPEVDTIELHNTTITQMVVTGWYLSDRNDSHRAFELPATPIAAGDYVTFNESDFNQTNGTSITGYSGALLAAPPTAVSSAGHGLSDGDIVTIIGYGGIGDYNGTFEVDVINGNTFEINAAYLDDHSTEGHWVPGRPFALSGAFGEKLYLIEADGSGNPSRFVDVIDFDGAFNGESLGRWANGAGTGTLVPMSVNTLGTENAAAQVGPVVISEVMYQPVSAPENDFEFVEIVNSGSVTENLANWRLRGGVDIDFTAAQELAPGEILVGVGFDPGTNTAATTAFRSAYGIDATVTLVGPWTDGPLVNEAGTVRLQRADTPPLEAPSYYPQVTEDEVRYLSVAPWPTSPAGGGDSLHRTDASLFGNFDSSWVGGAPTPGTHSLTGMDYDSYRDITFGPGSPPNSGRLDDFDLDGVINIIEYALGMDPKLPDAHLLPFVSAQGGQLTYTFRKNTLATDLTFQVEKSTNLITWNPVADSLDSTVGFIEIRVATVPMGTEPKQFLRLSISE